MYLGQQLDLSTTFVGDIPWQERERLWDEGEMDMIWMCGLPYIWKEREDPSQLDLLAAPVMKGRRYQNCPIYFSDVIIRRSSTYKNFSDLAGQSWAYNEPGSHSGFALPRYVLGKMGFDGGYFGRVEEAGSHLKALKWVIEGRVDAAALDSTVLDLEMNDRPQLSNTVRIIARWGPSPMPPWVIRRDIPRGLRENIRRVLCSMHETGKGRSILKSGLIHKMAPVRDEMYDLIRDMETIANQVEWYEQHRLNGIRPVSLPSLRQNPGMFLIEGFYSALTMR